MTGKEKAVLPPFAAFACYFALGYGAWGTVNSYFSVYFNSFGYSNTQIGILSAIGPFAAFFGLVFWGTIADRSKSRGRVVLVICMLEIVFSLLYLVSSNFFFTFVLTFAFMFCFYSLTPVGDAMFLEYSQSGKAVYGKGRAFGSVGLALLPMLPGLAISRWGILSLFPSYIVILLLIALVTTQLPRMQGGQRGNGKKLNLLSLRHDRQMVGLLVFLFLTHFTLGFYYSFFPVYMDNLGASNLIGLNNLLQFSAEIVFIVFSVRLVKRFSFARIYSVALMLTALRLLLIGSITQPWLFLIVNLFCGLGYSMCMGSFSLFALRTPKELRTSAQMLNTMVAHSFSRFLGSLLGGWLSDVFGIPAVFTGAGVLGIFIAAAFIIWWKKTGSLQDPVLMQ